MIFSIKHLPKVAFEKFLDLIFEIKLKILFPRAVSYRLSGRFSSAQYASLDHWKRIFDLSHRLRTQTEYLTQGAILLGAVLEPRYYPSGGKRLDMLYIRIYLASRNDENQ